MLEARNSNLAKEKLSLLEEIKRMREESLDQLELVRNENAQTHEQLTIANTKIDNLTNLVSTLNSLSTQLNESLPNSIFRCKYLENEMRDNYLIFAKLEIKLAH